jgi:hypothetical protein
MKMTILIAMVVLGMAAALMFNPGTTLFKGKTPETTVQSDVIPLPTVTVILPVMTVSAATIPIMISTVPPAYKPPIPATNSPTPSPAIKVQEVNQVLTTVKITMPQSDWNKDVFNITMSYFDQNNKEILQGDTDYYNIRQSSMDFIIMADGINISEGTFKHTPIVIGYSISYLKSILKACTGETVLFKFTKHYDGQTFPCEVSVPRADMIQ